MCDANMSLCACGLSPPHASFERALDRRAAAAAARRTKVADASFFFFFFNILFIPQFILVWVGSITCSNRSSFPSVSILT